FGMTTPQTIEGKILVVLYGFLGCSGAFLFFNLFLERIITFLAYILRYFHEMDLRRKGMFGGDRRDSQISYEDNLDQWKPSVYWVMLYLFLGCVFLAICASALYSPVENWTYFESLYFCFVAFATIGFGDYVSSQQPYYNNVEWYRLGNFIFIVCGSCFMYSLFNVISIVIKQFLNWVIKKSDCRCTCLKKSKVQIRPPIPRGRRNAITPEHLKQTNRTAPPKTAAEINEPDSTYDSEGERRNSDEMISMQDFLKSNKVSLAVMQKELHESALRGRAIILPPRPSVEEFKPGSVGPLAIASRKFGEDIA
ncbi:potassium channel subfamily K member 12-like, partial [Limulus polyphemus]|uniref:Potassium channel subfamily K member 12-like n=1 Tax=Limulus polyphemus TaxID=6850 RepID=A0ABM1BFB7_LIMPO